MCKQTNFLRARAGLDGTSEYFYMGDFTNGAFKNLSSYQFLLISTEVTAGKQYLFRIPVTIEGNVTRTFTLQSGLFQDAQK